MSHKTSDQSERTFDRERLKALVQYICYQCHDPSVLGATKLNKILWYSEVIAFARSGDSLTGETYVKQQFGPVPRHILGIIEDLETEGALVVREVEFYGRPKKEYVALKKPDIAMFTAEEISLVDSVIDVVCHKHTAASISMASHDAIWKLAEIGEDIPSYAALASELGEVTEDDVKWAKRVLSKTA